MVQRGPVRHHHHRRRHHRPGFRVPAGAAPSRRCRCWCWKKSGRLACTRRGAIPGYCTQASITAPARRGRACAWRDARRWWTSRASTACPTRPAARWWWPSPRASLSACRPCARTGRRNGLDQVEVVDRAGLRKIEPYAGGLGAIWVPYAGIINYRAVAAKLRDLLLASGATVSTLAEATGIRRTADGVEIDTRAGRRASRHLINCGGLYSDRIARLDGLTPPARIVAFRGDFFELAPAARHKVRGLIYPVPDPALPFLGVHLTRRTAGEVGVRSERRLLAEARGLPQDRRRRPRRGGSAQLPGHVAAAAPSRPLRHPRNTGGRSRAGASSPPCGGWCRP